MNNERIGCLKTEPYVVQSLELGKWRRGSPKTLRRRNLGGKEESRDCNILKTKWRYCIKEEENDYLYQNLIKNQACKTENGLLRFSTWI